MVTSWSTTNTAATVVLNNPICTASSQYSTYSVNNIISGSSPWLAGTSDSSPWVIIQNPVAFIPTGFLLYPDTTNGATAWQWSPATITVSASNNGTSWTTVGTLTSHSWTGASVNVITVNTSGVSYSYWKFAFTVSGSSYTGLQQILPTTGYWPGSQLTAYPLAAGSVFSSRTITTNLTYFETVIGTIFSTVGVGICVSGRSATATTLPGADAYSVGYLSTGVVQINGTTIATLSSYTSGATIGIAVDLTAQLIWFTLNGSTWNSGLSGTQNPSTIQGGISLTTMSYLSPRWATVGGAAISGNIGYSFNISVPSLSAGAAVMLASAGFVPGNSVNPAVISGLTSPTTLAINGPAGATGWTGVVGTLTSTGTGPFVYSTQQNMNGYPYTLITIPATSGTATLVRSAGNVLSNSSSGSAQLSTTPTTGSIVIFQWIGIGTVTGYLGSGVAGASGSGSTPYGSTYTYNTYIWTADGVTNPTLSFSSGSNCSVAIYNWTNVNTSGITATQGYLTGTNPITANFSSSSFVYTIPTNFSSIDMTNTIANNSIPKQYNTTPVTRPSPVGNASTYLLPQINSGGQFFPAGPITHATGVIQENGTPVAGRTVRIYDGTTGVLLGGAISGASGTFSIPALGRSQVTLVATDPTTYQAQAFDRITPQ